MLNKKFILATSCTAILSTGAITAQAGTLNATDARTSSPYTIQVAAQTKEEKALDFVKTMANDGISFLENEELDEDARKKEFRKLLKNNFDMKTIGKFALGSHWRTSSSAQQKEYLKLFEEMIVDVYSKRFGDYKGEKLDVTTATEKGKRDVVVSSVIVPKKGPKIDVDWRVRQQKNGSFKVIDIMVEGVSMSLTQRADFKSVIQRGGGDIEVLLAKLR